MRIVTAIDSFKGSMTSLDAGNAAAEGFRRADPVVQVDVRPLADGGEGTVEALTAGMGGWLEHVTVTGPLGRPTDCVYGIISGHREDTIGRHDSEKQNHLEERQEAVSREGFGQRTAVIEMSGAAGITLVSSSERNPMEATTYGVGEVIRDAIAKGCRRFLVGIGGSATNDGGVGMLQALGWDFLDADGNSIPRGAKGLEKLACIRDEHVMPELSECIFRIACDVDNPLCGPKGCSAVFGPQKGATPDMVAEMDRWLSQYAERTKEFFAQGRDASFPGGHNRILGNREEKEGAEENKRTEIPMAGTDPGYPGTGAAGGLGYAFRAFLHGELESGVKIVLEETHLEKYVKDADLVVTGEGRMDFQTSMGKAPVGVAALAKKYGIPVIALAGSVTRDARACNEKGIDAFFPIVRGVTTLEEAMNRENAKANMADAAEQALRLFLVGKGKD